jgi:hypothetical protein
MLSGRQFFGGENSGDPGVPEEALCRCGVSKIPRPFKQRIDRHPACRINKISLRVPGANDGSKRFFGLPNGGGEAKVFRLGENESQLKEPLDDPQTFSRNQL